MRFDKICGLLALLVTACCMQEASSAEPEQGWVRSAPPLADSSAEKTSRYTQRYNEPKPLPSAVASQPQSQVKAKGREFHQRLTALELALSMIVAEKPNLWRFDLLEAEAASLLMAASGEKDRQAVREVATRIDGFAAIANRYRDTRGTLARVDRNSVDPARADSTKVAPPTRLTKSQEPKPKKSEAAELGYDAVGVLRSVVSKRPEAPKFALVDGNGKVTTFLTPTPDLDLESMLGKRIGVKGSRGFMPAYKREHLTANRVTPLDTVRR